MSATNVTRRKFLALSAAAAAGSLLARSAARACPGGDIPPSDAAKKLAAGVTAFGLDLQRQLGTEKGGTFFSPFSVSAALAMTSAGARGETLEEMEKVLHLPDDPHPAFGELLARLNGTNLARGGRPYELATANAIWAQKDYPWRKQFVELTRTHYGAGLVETDFAGAASARREINAWVERETRDKIKKLIPDGVLTPTTRMVLTNAVYFKGDWQNKFDPKETKEVPFTRPDGSTAKAPLMNLAGDFRYAEFRLDLPTRDADGPWHAVQALEMPYVGGDLSMLVFLPRNPRAIRTVTDQLTPAHFAPAGGAVTWKERKVSVTLPRFKAEADYLLKKPLTVLGMKQAFGAADFTGMSPRGEDLYISHVLHKAFVEVNEEGSEAAAATGVVVKERSAARPVEFRADRPFVYAIRDNATGAVLFLGRYDGPK